MQQGVFSSMFRNKSDIFFDHFNQSAENATEMAKLLLEAISTNDEQKPQYAAINRLRTKSQEITRELFAESGRALVSPFERSDMTDLVKAIDTVAGYINISARRINLYQPKEITPPIKELAGLIVDICAEQERCILALAQIKKVDVITESVNAIKKLEHYADNVYNKAVAALLVTETNAIELIKYNEILLALETATDKAKLVGDVAESIVVKNT
ncbi:DUF47 domain-containing protein [Mucilaginibacter myungsuensis]|uniref:DUF47 family protein n=1 Tax=Mucilaginibacter myungsuensis TaxID=649104 RepID=A0A929PW13_9SPHI|nr:DUF47 family protein [Mucilaginibacter myungsuensis]MBE9661596.1 DUF47 family protein [Mucilaginibacter myungsuensis]MDN3597741.1 DUF47 family protein [Mucilaginibacter myungsuensis]